MALGWQGTYVIGNVSTDFDVKTIPTFFYGKWRLTLRLLRSTNSETMACMLAFGETVPKLRKRPAGGR